MKRILVALGFRKWLDIDFDQGWHLQECAWTGERRTVVRGYNIRMINPCRKPRWQKPRIRVQAKSRAVSLAS